MKPIIIIIDASYYCYHRYFSLLKWWKSAYPDCCTDALSENTIFVDKFKKTFVEKIKEIPKKLGLDKSRHVRFIAGKDCSKNTIWRKEFLQSYKQNRILKEGIGAFFELTFADDLFKEA